MATKKKKTPTKMEPAPAADASNSSSAHRSLVIDERVLVTAVAVVVACAFVWRVREVLIPLLFVAVVTFVGAPLVGRLERAGVPRGVGAGVFLVGGLSIFAGLIAIVAPPLVRDVARLLEKLPALVLAATTFIEAHAGVTLPRSLSDLSNAASQELLDQLSPVAAKGGALVGAGAAGLARGALSADELRLGANHTRARLRGVEGIIEHRELAAHRARVGVDVGRQRRALVERVAQRVESRIGGRARRGVGTPHRSEREDEEHRGAKRSHEGAVMVPDSRVVRGGHARGPRLRSEALFHEQRARA